MRVGVLQPIDFNFSKQYSSLSGILSTNSESDEKDLAEQSIDKVDYVVCNLYPFKDTVSCPGVVPLFTHIESQGMSWAIKTRFTISPLRV